MLETIRNWSFNKWCSINKQCSATKWCNSEFCSSFYCNDRIRRSVIIIYNNLWIELPATLKSN